MGIRLPVKELSRAEEAIHNLMPVKRIDVTLEGNVLYLPSGVYRPFPTLEEFHNDNSDIKIIVGPVGSGKSTGLTCELIIRAIRMPKCLDGVRRSKFLIIRNTYDELKSTSLQMWKEWSEGLGSLHTNMQPPITHSHEFYDKNGKICLDIIFLALNREESFRKLLSYNITSAYINEARELPFITLSYLGGRTGRYPPKRTLPKGTEYWHGVLLDTNAPKAKHWIPELEKSPVIEYKDADGKTKQIVSKVFHQPPALLENDKGEFVVNPKAENIENLPGGYEYYFKRLSAGKNFVRVYVQGKYGSLRQGKPVYEKYNDDLHSAEKLDVTPNVPIVYGVDYGRVCPAILLTQFVAGQLRCLKEICGHHIYIKDMAEEELIPWLKANAPKASVNGPVNLMAYGFDDCAQTEDGRTQLRSLNLDVRAARTNRIEPRLAAVNNLLGRLTSAASPAVVISRAGCPMLREGFLGEYKLEERHVIGSTEYKETPDKSHPYSDIQDALQYVALNYANVDDIPQTNVQCKQYKPKSMWV